MDKSKISLIRQVQENISLMKINNIILFDTCIVLSFSLVIYYFSIHFIREFSYCHFMN